METECAKFKLHNRNIDRGIHQTYCQVHNPGLQEQVIILLSSHLTT